MSLRSNFTGALDAKLAEARAAGRNVVIDRNNEPDPVSGLSNAMAAAALQGKKSFTYNAPATFQPEDLRLDGDLWQAYRSGILQGLFEQDIMANEVDVKLNVSDQVNTSVDIIFSL